MKKIPLTKGMFALVDDEDFKRLSAYNWAAWKNGKGWYATRKPSKKMISMHREILNVPSRKITDHIDRNSLNNQRSNLRVCTRQQNGCNRGPNKNNTSGFKGVTWWKRDKNWSAQIRVNRKNIKIGYFENKTDAAKAYNDAALRHHGEFAYQNPIE